MAIKYYSRKCDECNKGMEEGYVWGDGDGYACSDKCLFVHGYTPKEAREDTPGTESEAEALDVEE